MINRIKRESLIKDIFSSQKQKKPAKAKQCFQKQDNFLVYRCRFCLETYLPLDRLPSWDDESHLPACYYMIPVARMILTQLLTNYITDSTETIETIKLATLLPTTIWIF